ncbi:hypothetical protein AVEN_190969-1 [Araneus ventricosus]|uniref:Uncharacterized protein n=1 Tax=Araneus ventricosus TaxID=182803 RepID=A0A4Y2NAF2_ARAVE|nr:hypothetical protein AVEN_190969-1 [Araneus ventricosus]
MSYHTASLTFVFLQGLNAIISVQCELTTRISAAFQSIHQICRKECGVSYHTASLSFVLQQGLNALNVECGLTTRISAAFESIAPDMPKRVWDELPYRLAVVRVSAGLTLNVYNRWRRLG